jgi:hypothetical protein
MTRMLRTEMFVNRKDLNSNVLNRKVVYSANVLNRKVVYSANVENKYVHHDSQYTGSRNSWDKHEFFELSPSQ